MFDPYLDELNKLLIVNHGEILLVPDGLQECYSKKQDAVIRSWLWSVPGFRRWRVTRMDVGDKLQVFNSVAYPDYLNEQPIMGIDLLWFGIKNKLVAVLDFQPLVQEKSYFDRYYQGLKSLKARYSDFNSKDNVRAYDLSNYFSPWVLLCKGDLFQASSSLPFVFSEFLNAYFDISNNFKKYNSRIEPNRVKELQISYDIYSSAHDPAHGLFKSYFGKQWSERFLKEFLFPHSIAKDKT
ncbi:15,16-dihydrobiliverdin:ferredoxin oxidoreductase [Prochlorococcus marinus]|uniref:15,16-dihydrobiliverdin:ferredoxin oxidoreductase n=1 Tax=Prochlorococcus marinus (strain MIT 9211) TaxID=93059 RepID=PEBA_PROM4|nr:15,16-dihydrobiliverdin:ferredoxin oxidoreductase [Prochlorococcus marinus]A9BCT3.1 RecName: Full=15,16-dihydrobiliverdin:ferredoxin oxidoreductase [Prochlorococcus marinus str. MIT 9211]ABX09645.1 phycoerythrobilin:ferredoxin oxidoreductase [Prochlorococcus marinus str. MIT 9211]